MAQNPLTYTTRRNEEDSCQTLHCFSCSPRFEREHIAATTPALIFPDPGQVAQHTSPSYRKLEQLRVYSTQSPLSEVRLSQEYLHPGASFQLDAMPIPTMRHEKYMTHQKIDHQAPLDGAFDYNDHRALERKDVFRLEHSISRAPRATVDSGHEQASSAQVALPDSRKYRDNKENSVKIGSLFKPKNTRDLQTQLRRYRKVLKRAGVRKENMEIEQSSVLPKIYEIQTKGAVAHVKHEV